MFNLSGYFKYSLATRAVGFGIDALIIIYASNIFLAQFYIFNGAIVLVFGLCAYATFISNIYFDDGGVSVDTPLAYITILLSSVTGLVIVVSNNSSISEIIFVVALLISGLIHVIQSMNKKEKKLVFYVSAFYGNLALLAILYVFIANGLTDVAVIFVVVLLVRLGNAVNLSYSEIKLVSETLYRKLKNNLGSFKFEFLILLFLSIRASMVFFDRVEIELAEAPIFSPATRWCISVFGLLIVPFHLYLKKISDRLLDTSMYMLFIANLCVALFINMVPVNYVWVSITYFFILSQFALIDNRFMVCSSHKKTIVFSGILLVVLIQFFYRYLAGMQSTWTIIRLDLLMTNVLILSYSVHQALVARDTRQNRCPSNDSIK